MTNLAIFGGLLLAGHAGPENFSLSWFSSNLFRYLRINIIICDIIKTVKKPLFRCLNRHLWHLKLRDIDYDQSKIRSDQEL